MRKKLLYLVALFTSFALTLNAQECTSLTLTVGGGDYDSEISWSLNDGDTLLVGTYDLCLEDGLYTFNMIDSWGDGWNGATWEMLNSEGDTVASGGLSEGAAASQDFTIGDVAVAGCTDSEALNYSDLATEDDGSCEYPAEGSVSITVDGGTYQSEVSWSITDCDGNVIIEGGAPFSGLAVVPENAIVVMEDSFGDGWNGNILTVGELTFELASGASSQALIGVCGTPGCTDATAANYNADATIDDGSCAWECPLTLGGVDVTDTDCYDYVWNQGMYSVEDMIGFGFDCSCVEDPIFGCLDENADNYNADADLDGPCEYTVICADNETEVSVMMMDSFGDGWDEGTLVVGDDTLSLPSGTEGSATLCLADGVYDVTAGGSMYQMEISWTISMGEDTLAGGSPYAGALVVGDVAVPGCTDADALNYNPSATEDDESCEYFSCDLDEVTVTLNDSYGDGGGQITVDGNVLTNPGSSNSMTVCIDLSACTAVDYVSTDIWSTENSWEVTDASGAVLASGADASGNVGTCAVLGCTDETAFNYNPIATEDDGSCMEIVVGCVDPTAFNYDPGANTADDSCIYVECPDGTTQATATLGGGDYDAEIYAEITSPSGQPTLSGGAGTYDICISPNSVYSVMLTDTYGDGWNGATFTVTTCDGLLTAATGTIEQDEDLETLNDTLVEFEFSIQPCDSYTWGCMDMNASNYDPAANADDGSCSYPGCMDDAYLEFDEGATVDDGTCVTLIVEGCIDVLALNYSQEANFNDGSCEYAIVCEDAALTGIQLIMNDSFGDGWNGADLTISSPSGYMDVVDMPTTGNSDTSVFCLPADCYQIAVSSGSWDGEISWSISTALGSEPVLSGGASTTSFLSVGSDADCSVDNFNVGCMDPWASNYDPAATSDDGSCSIPFSINCDVAQQIIFDETFAGDSDFNMWFTFTAEDNQVLVSDITGGSSFVQWSSSIFSSCDDTESLEGGLSAGTYYVMIDHDATFNIAYEVTFSLEDGIVGCQDQYANNYDPSANIQGECDYSCDDIATTLTIVTPSFSADQIAFDLLSADGEVVAQGGYDGEYIYDSSYEINLCLVPGEYTMNAYEDGGSGWGSSNEGSTGFAGYSFTYSCDQGEITAANNDGAAPNNGEFGTFGEYELESSETFTVYSCSDLVYGCTDETADNYNADANVDEGCQYFGCTDFNYFEYDPAANVDDGSCSETICPEGSSVFMISAGGGTWDVEVSWSLASCDGDSITGGLAGETLYCSSEDAFQINMMDSYGDGWNGATLTINGIVFGEDFTAGTEATALFGDCGLPGCIDPLALNFDSNASVDDGSCEYCTAPTSLVSIEVGGGAWQGEVSWVVFTCEGDTLLSGGAPYEESSCMELPDAYVVQMIDSYGDGWNGNVLTINNVDYELLAGSSEEVIVGDCGFVYGCTDPNAANYDDAANTDDGTCEFLCSDDETQVSIIMIDSWGDGWNGASLVLNNTDDLTSTPFTLVNGSIDYADACMNLDECYNIVVGGGSYDYEIEWAITNADGSPIADGFAPDSLFVGTCLIDGCTDETALNYDPNATVDDGTCIATVEGCMDDAYAEYNSDANVEVDGSCVTLLCAGNVVSLSVGGGTYDGEISWTLGENIGVAGDYDLCLEDGCYDFMMVDSWGDGWNGAVAVFTMDGVELLTATIESGESGMAVVSINGDCGVLGCTDASATNYNADATTDDGSCYYEGCTDSSADNYDPTATVDDGSCMFSCEDGTAQVDILITTDIYADETGFTLTDDEGGVYSVALTSAQNTSTVTSTFCVDNGSDMTFILSDSYGDGFLDNNGGYQIYVCQELVHQDFNLGMFNAVSYEFYAVCGDIMGCMDPNALNFDSEATMDNGSCQYPCTALEATVVINTSGFGYEIGWSLEDAAGNQIAGDGGSYDNNASYEIDVCLEEGADYNFNMSDSYGDGWNGGTFTVVSADCGELAAGGLDDGDAGQVSFTADCGSDCEAPADWAVTVTGSNHTIMISDESIVSLADGNILTNANVGVFFTNSNGDLQCAGYTEVTGETVQIAAMGDDTTTDEIDGLTSGDDLVWMIADCNGNVMAATATYTFGPETFTINGLTFVGNITEVPAGPSCQTIDMPSGWSMFSTYMIAEDMDLAAVLAPIVDNVIIAKNNAGDAYLVEWDFNGINDMVVGQGYQIKTDAAVSLEICGDYAAPEDNPIDIIAGWNMIGYLRTEGADAISVLSDMNDSGNLIIAKDYNGNAYLPEFNFNGINDMEPGQGYQLKTENDDVLQYLSNDESYRLSSLEVTENNVSHFSKVIPTDNNMTVVIEDAAWDVLPTEGSEVAAFDKAGNLIGSAIYSSPVTVLTVWGDDAMTSEKEGSLVSEAVSFKVFTSGDVRDFTVTEWAEGSSTYLVDAINVASSIEINTVVADANSSDRVLVKVINVLGQEVELNDESFKGEVLFNVYDDGSVEQFVK